MKLRGIKWLHQCGMRSCYRKYWKRWAGIPLRVLMNNGKEFDQKFYMVWNIIGVIIIPPRLIHPIKMAWLNVEGECGKTYFWKWLRLCPRLVGMRWMKLLTKPISLSIFFREWINIPPHQYVFGKEHGIPGNLVLRDEKLGGNINSTSWRNNVSQETGDSEQSTDAVHSGT